MRVTERELERLCNNINIASRSPLSQFKEVKAPDGTTEYKPNVGVFFLDQAYGMICLSQHTEDGVSCIFGFSSKVELKEKMRSFLNGIYFAISQKIIGTKI